VDDIATTQADVTRKLSVSEAYSQGATNILNFSYQDNCDSFVPAIIPFYIDDDVQNVNTCELTYSTKKYRGYTSSALGGGGVVFDTASASVPSVPSSHVHALSTQQHIHNATLKVIEFNVIPSSIAIRVDGNLIPSSALSGERINLVSYLAKTGGAITRGKHEIVITPSDVARIEANVILRVFIQSRIGGIY